MFLLAGFIWLVCAFPLALMLMLSCWILNRMSRSEHSDNSDVGAVRNSDEPALIQVPPNQDPNPFVSPNSEIAPSKQRRQTDIVPIPSFGTSFGIGLLGQVGGVFMMIGLSVCMIALSGPNPNQVGNSMLEVVAYWGGVWVSISILSKLMLPISWNESLGLAALIGIQFCVIGVVIAFALASSPYELTGVSF